MVHTSDLDGDNRPDVLYGSVITNEIAWFKNGGNGQFGAKQVIATVLSQPKSIFAADLDSDGDQDVLVASQYDNKVVWCENTGNGSFGAPINLTTSLTLASGVHAADLDSDGDMDVLAIGGAHEKQLFENLGSGNFSSPQSFGGNSGFGESVTTSDLDGDGDLDVLYGQVNGGNPHLGWVENLGNLSFANFQSVSNQYTGLHNILSKDLDGDGDLDLLAVSGTDSKLAWHENQGNTNFSAVQRIISIRSNFAIDLQVIDLDGDGDEDLVAASQYDSKIAWYENQGPGTFFAQQILTEDADSILTLDVADFNGDGELDLLMCNPENPGFIAWFENLGGLTFGAKQIISNQALLPSDVIAADVNGDGNMDVVSASKGDGKIAWYENTGTGNFGPQQVITTQTNQPNSVFASDLDNDGDLDVLSASRLDDKVAWYENTGNGAFGPQQILNAGALYASRVHVADLDNDGFNDVLSLSMIDHEVVWYRNLGNGSFSADIVISTQVFGHPFIHTVDLDADGLLDVITSSTIGLPIVMHRNLGGGVMNPTPEVLLSELNAMHAVRSGDFDGDGDIDLASVSQRDERIAWYENQPEFTSKATGRLFTDLNQNGVQDPFETTGLSLMGVYSQPKSGVTFSQPSGHYELLLDNGPGTYEIIPLLPPGWLLTSDSASYHVNVDSLFVCYDSLDFGYFPDSAYDDLNLRFVGAFPRCNDTVNYWLSIYNEGTTRPGGTIHLKLDDSIIYVSAGITPDLIVGQNLYWHFDSLDFFASSKINLQVLMPDFNSIGDTLCSSLCISVIDSQGDTTWTGIDSLKQVVACAYDPNDKGVTPVGDGPEGFIPLDQELSYLVRFQNTGNDTAIHIEILDQLDSNLLWNTLKPISSSHYMETTMEPNGEVSFYFPNILLPDSGANFQQSQGYVEFTIQTKPGLAPQTPIENQAEIYFDSNPAIITNTVLNTINCYNTPKPVLVLDSNGFSVSVLGNYTYQWYYNDSLVAGATTDQFQPILDGLYQVQITDSLGCSKRSTPYGYWTVGLEERVGPSAIVYPNPFTSSTTIRFSEDLRGNYNLLVVDISGREVIRIDQLDGIETTIQNEALRPGIYLALLQNRQTGSRIQLEKLVVQ